MFKERIIPFLEHGTVFSMTTQILSSACSRQRILLQLSNEVVCCTNRSRRMPRESPIAHLVRRHSDLPLCFREKYESCNPTCLLERRTFREAMVHYRVFARSCHLHSTLGYLRSGVNSNRRMVRSDVSEDVHWTLSKRSMLLSPRQLRPTSSHKAWPSTLLLLRS